MTSATLLFAPICCEYLLLARTCRCCLRGLLCRLRGTLCLLDLSLAVTAALPLRARSLNTCIHLLSSSYNHRTSDWWRDPGRLLFTLTRTTSEPASARRRRRARGRGTRGRGWTAAWSPQLVRPPARHSWHWCPASLSLRCWGYELSTVMHNYKQLYLYSKRQ